MAQGCILGQITVEFDVNDQLDWIEDPGGGLEQTLSTSITAGAYFPDSDTASEDLALVIKTAMDAESLASGNTWEYVVSVSATNGMVSIEASSDPWRMLCGTGYEDSVFPELGFPASDVDSTSTTISATIQPRGTWFPKTNRDGEERKWDTNWEYIGNGASSRGPTGKIVSISTGFSRDRSITYSRIVPDDVYGGLVRAQVCFGDHWYKQNVMRIFADRVITGTNFFDGKLRQDSRNSWKPQRYSASFETYEWTFDFAEDV